MAGLNLAGRGTPNVCPRCSATSLTSISWAVEDFVRLYCACGATGRLSRDGESAFEEVPLPASMRKSEPEQSSDQLASVASP